MNSYAYKFFTNIHSLRRFLEDVSPLADDQAIETAIKPIERVISKLEIPELDHVDVLSRIRAQIQTIIRKLESIHSSELCTNSGRGSNPITIEDSQVNECEVVEEKSDFRNIIEDLPSLPTNIQQTIIRFLIDVLKHVPAHGHLLREGLIATAVSQFEVLVAELVEYYYLSYPNALNPEAHTISLSQLRAINSVTEAEKLIVDGEVDALLRRSLSSQLDYFVKKLSVNLDPLDLCKVELIEVFNRRNILIHNNGAVNSQYLGNTPQILIDRYEAKPGLKLGACKGYCRKALDSIQIVGVMLIQQCWRKWLKSEPEMADSFLHECIYEALIDHRFEVAKRLALYGCDLELNDDETRRVLIINHAIALKSSNEIDEMEDLLDKYDWSACSIKYQVALLALRNRTDLLQDLLLKAVRSEEISKEEIAEWPLFHDFRNTEEYNELMNAIDSS